MDKRYLCKTYFDEFGESMRQDEKSSATIEKYLRDVWKFWQFAAGRLITKDLVIEYKEKLVRQAYAVRSINSMLASLNSFLRFLGWEDLAVKSLKQQTMIFSPEEKELTKAEYMRLLEAARSQPQLSLILQTICATGIRVSELRYFTVESVRRGEVRVYCKNKNRTILIPGRLKSMLLRYAREKKNKNGMHFYNKKRKAVGSKQYLGKDETPLQSSRCSGI